MKRNLIITSVLVLTLGFGITVYAKGINNLEAFSKLSKSNQELLIETMKESKESKKELWMEMKEAKKAMHDALVAENFDEAKFQASADKLAELKIEKMRIMTDTVKELASKFSQEERAALAEILPKGKHRHGHHKRYNKEQ